MTVFEGYKVTSNYGYRNDPFGSGKKVFHAGIDLVRNHKAPIHAFASGQVLYAGPGKSGTGLGGYGTVVFIKDSNGRGHLYAHLDSVAVKAGAQVSKDQIVGYQGATGQVTGSHLHYEVRKGTNPSYGWTANAANSTLDPKAYLESLAGSGNNVGKTLYLHADQEQWAIYDPKVQPIKKNANKVPLRPKKFGGLSYKILANPNPHVYTIQTSQFGKMNIVVKPEYSGFTIK
ncbi:MAG TPA: M23 family metallopeptidase [Bacillaceae bacterium]